MKTTLVFHYEKRGTVEVPNQEAAKTCETYTTAIQITNYMSPGEIESLLRHAITWPSGFTFNHTEVIVDDPV
jgi:hypothetical protein